MGRVLRRKARDEFTLCTKVGRLLEADPAAPYEQHSFFGGLPFRVRYDYSAEATLRSIPEYVKAFGRAFPNDPWPVTVNNTAKALGAFERKLFTRGRWDLFLEGDPDALTSAEKEGFNTFVEVGCVTCHFGPHVGATMFQKLGLVRSWPDTMDRGVFEITKKQADFMVFRVPTLRNVAATAPYFHDGSVSSLQEAVRLMGKHQLGKDLNHTQVEQIVVWLKSLTGDLPKEYITKPELPESGPNTPKPVAD